jgi:redox-sensitive bicupin YhaK (pirin superfamily)
MEIITVILAGALEHRDSLGNGAVIRPGEVQRMSAGTGVRHSEFNPSATQPTHLLQIWIAPGKLGERPGYEQALAAHADGWQLLAAPPAQGAAVVIHQDARLLRLQLSPGERAEQMLAPGRLAYVHVISGSPILNGVPLSIGDGAKLADEARLHFSTDTTADLLLFDLPA